MEKKRYTVVGFSHGIGYTLQKGGFINSQIERGIKYYKRLTCAVKAAKGLKLGFDKVCVYENGKKLQDC